VSEEDCEWRSGYFDLQGKSNFGFVGSNPTTSNQSSKQPISSTSSSLRKKQEKLGQESQVTRRESIRERGQTVGEDDCKLELTGGVAEWLRRFNNHHDRLCDQSLLLFFLFSPLPSSTGIYVFNSTR